MDAVLLLAHGTPESLDEMPAYLANVRGGRPPSPELVEEMRHNYGAIGGRSPLTDITRAQAQALSAELGQPVYVGMRNWAPYIKDALAQARADGITSLVAVPMAPQYSTLSVAKYRDAIQGDVAQGLDIRFVDAWHDQPALLDAFAGKVTDALAHGPRDTVIFTAHSLPQRVVREGDPYPDHVAATARGVAQRAGVADYRLGYQSAGRTPEPWLGPALDDVVREVADAGARSVLVAPIGFVCDHTEILFDIDVQAAAVARERGLDLARTESLNTDPRFIRALAAVVRGQV